MSRKRVLMRVRGVPIYWDGTKIEFTAGFTVDGDGSPHCYHPSGSPPGLDYLANAGRPGRWWGIATHNGKPDGRPVIQGANDPAPGFYVSTTSLMRKGYSHRNPKAYIDAETTPYIVIPRQLNEMIKPIVLGCQATAINEDNGRTVGAVVADEGPADHLGEGSIATAKALRIPSSPKNGGTERRVIAVTLWPGVPAVVNGETFDLQPA